MRTGNRRTSCYALACGCISVEILLQGKERITVECPLGYPYLMHITDMKKGFIYKYKNSRGKHPFVFMDYQDGDYFIGCMLTSTKNSSQFPDNIALSAEHFKTYVNELGGKEYSVKFKNSNFVSACLVKRSSDVSSKEYGELTKEGLMFIENEIMKKPKMSWDEFLERNIVR